MLFRSNGREIFLGDAYTKFLSSEVAGGFTGVVIGLYAVGNHNRAEFTNLECTYDEWDFEKGMNI